MRPRSFVTTFKTVKVSEHALRSNAEHRAELTCEIIVRRRSLEISFSAPHQSTGRIGSIRAAEGMECRERDATFG